MPLDVIFIDDEVDLCDLYVGLFEEDDIKVHSFAKHSDAAAYVKKHGADLIFIDYRMPEKDGIECRKDLPLNIPCYLITGELDLDLPGSFVGLIRKPLRDEAFNAIIEKLKIQKHKNP